MDPRRVFVAYLTLLIAILLSWWLGGCAQGPAYNRPQVVYYSEGTTISKPIQAPASGYSDVAPFFDTFSSEVSREGYQYNQDRQIRALEDISINPSY